MTTDLMHSVLDSLKLLNNQDGEGVISIAPVDIQLPVDHASRMVDDVTLNDVQQHSS